MGPGDCVAGPKSGWSPLVERMSSNEKFKRKEQRTIRKATRAVERDEDGVYGISLDSKEIDGRKSNSGRPLKTSRRDERLIKRQIGLMRLVDGSFSYTRVQRSCGLNNMSNSTFCYELKKMGYSWRSTRRKGKLLPKDLVKRVEFCKKMERLALNTNNFWCEG